MRFFVFVVVVALVIPACEELFPSDDDSNSSNGDYSSETYTITVVSERYDTVEVRLDGKFKGNLMGYGEKLEFTAETGEHTIEFWGQVGWPGNPEDVLIDEETFFLDEDIIITIKPL